MSHAKTTILCIDECLSDLIGRKMLVEQSFFYRWLDLWRIQNQRTTEIRPSTQNQKTKKNQAVMR